MLNSIEVLKRHLPVTAEELPLQPKKRNKNAAQKPAQTTVAPKSAAASSSTHAAQAPVVNHAESLLHLRSIARITEKAAGQYAAALQVAMPPSAPAPSVPFLADSGIAEAVPLFPGSVMRRVPIGPAFWCYGFDVAQLMFCAG
jgi:hypothetical protein